MDIHSQVIEVIATTYTKGSGTTEDPVRKAISYFSLKGEFLFERDEYDIAIEEDRRIREQHPKSPTS